MPLVADDAAVESDASDAEAEETSPRPRPAPGATSPRPAPGTMPMLESLEPSQFSAAALSGRAKPGAGGGAAMELLKSPFLLPAPLLALNPSLYAAQLAQLQAAQLLFAKQQSEAAPDSGDKNGLSSSDRKRSIEEDSPLDLGSKAAKYPRSSSPIDGRREPNSESPLDLSGNKSPEVSPGSLAAAFPPLLPPNLLSLFNQMGGLQQQQQPGLASSLAQLSPRSPSPSPPVSRGSPWQSQWMSKSSEGSRMEEVFKCVWCKESFLTLEALTAHMKEAKHHALPYPLPQAAPLRPGPGQPAASSPLRTSVSMSSPVSSLATSPKPAPVRDILKEQLPIPRKLVRGQDVWIGRADQQTKDILKCMSCGESFRSLELLTKHMQETQHYKKVISHDQISAWKYPETQQQSSKNHVNSVLSCKVCDKGFSSLKDLSDHMVKANHYTVEANKLPRAPAPSQAAAASAAAKDRKKALPVKKLLELERARQEVAGNKSEAASREVMESGKLMCERCEEKIPLDIFIPHIQQCVGRPRFLKAAAPEPAAAPSANNKDSKGGSKAEAKEAGGGDGSSSILGSLEQLVKGNFTSSASKVAPPISSPVPSFPAPQSSPLAKFNITSLFPVARSVSPPSSSPGSSKPASPNNNSNHLQQPSLEKMLDSPIEPRPAPSPAPASTAAAVNGAADRESPASEASGSSPHSQLTEKREAEAAEAEDGSSEAGDTKPAGHNALAALQSFCNDQTKPAKQGGAREVAGAVPATSAAAGSPMSDPGAILAFSWAVNQATASTGSPGGDTAIKCPFCETPFISKGAYRHHLSKMHFTKENLGNISTANIPQVTGQAKAQAPAANRTPSPEAKDAEESLQSKYQKYSQLAKQLSCYDGTN